CAPDNRFTGRANDKLLLQFRLRVHDQLSGLFRIVLKPVVRYYCAFFGKTLRILLFRFKETFWYEERKIGMRATGVLEHLVNGLLHLFPDAVSVRLDHHTTAYIGVLSQICLLH